MLTPPRFIKLIPLSLAAALCLLATAVHSQDAVGKARPPKYRIVEVQLPPGTNSFGLTNFNQKLETAVTASDAENQYHLWLGKNRRYREVRVPEDEGNAGGTSLNDLSEIMGATFGGNNPSRYFIWRDGQFEFLTQPPGSTGLELYYLNNRDQIFGFMIDSLQFRRPVMWEEGHFFRLPELSQEDFDPSFIMTDIAGINDAGVAVGFNRVGVYDSDGVWTGGFRQLPVRWMNGAVIQLPMPRNEIDNGFAVDVNNQNHIIGSVESDFVLWHDDQLTILPRPEGCGTTAVWSMNDRDQIVGSGTKPGGQTCMLLWDRGAVYDLLSLVSDRDPLKQRAFNFPQQILNGGQILVRGSGFPPPGSSGFYLFIPQD